MVYFAEIADAQLIQGFGIPAAIVITALVAVIVLLYREIKIKESRYDNIQEQRIAEAKETLTKVAEPLDKIAKLTEQMHDDILRNFKGN